MPDNLRARPAIFLDRDGTLIEDTGYIGDPELVQILPGVTEALRELQEDGFALIVISNQSGVGRGLITRQQAEAVDIRFQDLFQSAGIQFDGIYYCPHAPEEDCSCRKPRPGMIRKAIEDLGLSVKGSFAVGDKISDAQAGQQIGITGIVLQNPKAISNNSGFLTATSLLEIPAIVRRLNDLQAMGQSL